MEFFGQERIFFLSFGMMWNSTLSPNLITFRIQKHEIYLDLFIKQIRVLLCIICISSFLGEKWKTEIR